MVVLWEYSSIDNTFSKMRSTSFGRISMRSNISSTYNPTSMSKIPTPSSTHSISNQMKFNLVEELIMYPKADQYIDPNYRNRRNDSYQGEHRNGKKWGIGSFWFEDGDFYHGHWENDEPQGEGILYFWDSEDAHQPTAYLGNFDKGVFHGFGKLFKIVSPREGIYIYQGNWKNGQRQGTGKEYYHNDQNLYYNGSWSEDNCHGPGSLYFHQGQFEGNWENGMMNGDGRLSLKNGPIKTVLQGNWKNNELNNGQISYYLMANGLQIGTYNGEIKNYLRNGKGVYKTGTASYEGYFSDDQPVDKGTLAGKTPQHNWTLTGDLNRLVDILAQINYSNQDKYNGRVDIKENTVYRTKGTYLYGEGGGYQGQFEDNWEGELRGNIREIR